MDNLLCWVGYLTYFLDNLDNQLENSIENWLPCHFWLSLISGKPGKPRLFCQFKAGFQHVYLENLSWKTEKHHDWYLRPDNQIENHAENRLPCHFSHNCWIKKWRTAFFARLFFMEIHPATCIDEQTRARLVVEDHCVSRQGVSITLLLTWVTLKGSSHH